MKLRDFLILMVIFLAVLLVAIICDQYTRHRPNPVPVPPIEDHKPISPEELERQYQDIDRELKEKDKKGIGHINPGDALTPPPGKLPPEY